MRNLSDEQYKSWVDAGSPTAAEQWPELLRLRDLEATLREARVYAEQERKFMGDNYGYTCMGVVYADNQIKRIDAVLSAASGEASGEIECLGCPEIGPGCLCPRAVASRRPAPSEAPNVRRARKLHERFSPRDCGPPRGCVDDMARCYCDDEIGEIKAALDSARAEGIAAERERIWSMSQDLLQIFHARPDIWTLCGFAERGVIEKFTASFRGAKP